MKKNGNAGHPRESEHNGPVIRQMTLRKGDGRFVFRYTTGHEVSIIDAFAELAANPESPFNWCDAAILSYHMGRRLETELDKLLE